MTEPDFLWLGIGGLVAGFLAGLLGIGGGTVLVPLLVALHYTPVQAVGTSSFAILLTALSGTLQNTRMDVLQWRRVLSIGLPAVLTAQVGTGLAIALPPRLLLLGFGGLLLLNLYLVSLRQQLSVVPQIATPEASKWWLRLLTGGSAGLLAGLFGVGGGVILVPLQMLLLKEPIKAAIQNSLAVIPLTAVSATVGHGIAGNVVYPAGTVVGLSGIIAVQFSTRFLPQLPDRVVRICFRTLLLLLVVYVFWQVTTAQ